MAQDPYKPKDSGRIGLPRIGPGDNKFPPPKGDATPSDAKGGLKSYKPRIKAISDNPDDEDKQEEQDRKDAQHRREFSARKKGRRLKKRDKKKSIMLGAGDSQDDKDQVILERIRKRMDLCIQAEADNRRKGLDDIKFKIGDQWPADIAAQRNTDQRPCMVINKLRTFINQIVNDWRQNRPEVTVSPVGDGTSDKDGAKMFKGMIRAIERDSSADIAYDTAMDSSTSIGFGYWRILTEYEPQSFNQVLVLKRVRNAFTVYLDPNHLEPDGADCRYGFITDMMPRDEFEEEYPNAQPVPFMLSGQGESYKNWVGKDQIRVAEYYEIEIERRKLIQLSNNHVGWEDELSDDVRESISNGSLDIINEREAEVPKMMWYKVTALEILDRKPQVFMWIPIIPVIGNEDDVEGKVVLSGIVRDMKDPQRRYNYWVTSETELVALQPKAPYIMEEGQAEGHEQQWKNANDKNFPYLLYKGTSVNGKPAPPPQRAQPPQVPQGIIVAKEGAAQDMMAVSGIRFDATKNERMIDESGVAIESLRRTGDLTTFHYGDNMSRSMRHSTRIMIAAIPKVYDTKRIVTIIRDDDKDEQIQLDPKLSRPYQEVKQPNGKTLKQFNPSSGRYGVTVTIGPSFATKRIEAARNMIGFAKALPQTANLIADLIAKNMDWNGAEEMATRLAKALPPQLLTPEQKDVSPQIQAILQHMDQKIKELIQENQKLMMALTEKQSDRAQKQDKIDKDFEAKLLAIVQRTEDAVAKVSLKGHEAAATVNLELAKMDEAKKEHREDRAHTTLSTREDRAHSDTREDVNAERTEHQTNDKYSKLEKSHAELTKKLEDLHKKVSKPRKVRLEKGKDGKSYAISELAE